jgi:nucleotide-binding universal stress UspA family protein
VYRNILVAFDGSPSSEAALEEAISVARPDGARLVVLAVAVPPRFRYTGPVYVPYPTELDLERGAWNLVEHAQELVPPDVPVSGVVRVGRPVREIVARAEQGGHDLVIVGSRGLGLVGSIVLGSVSRAVEARSPVPVRVVGRSGKDRRRSSLSPSRAPSHPEPSATAMGVESERADVGATTLALWLLVALLLEVQLTLWMFERM